jgi:hypothetical protein
MPTLLLRLPMLVRFAFPSMAIGFIAGAAWARRRSRSLKPVPVQPRPQRDVIDVPWGEA